MKSKMSGLLALVLMFSVLGCLAQETKGMKAAPPPKPDAAGAAGTPTPAPELSPAEARKTLQEQYGGVVIDNTITVAGQDFFRSFSFFWREKPMNERYAVSIHERPSARLGNQVWVEHNNTRVYQTILPTLRAQINLIADIAAANSYQTIADLEVQRLLFKDPDLGADEF